MSEILEHLQDTVMSDTDDEILEHLQDTVMSDTDEWDIGALAGHCHVWH